MAKFISPRPNNAKSTLTLPKSGAPRNPLVSLGLMRQAGRHKTGNPRQLAARDLRQQLLLQQERSP